MSKITIIEGNSNDKDNVRTFMVKGEKGADGVSPSVSVIRSTGKATIEVTDAEGTTSADVNDGVSPTVTVSKSNGVTTITITDVNGTHTATINDGEVSQNDFDSLVDRVGSNSQLETETDDTLVAAINEVNSKATTVQTFKETVQPTSSYSSHMPFTICWKRVGKVVTIDLQITITPASSGNVNSGMLVPVRYNMNIPSWVIPSSSYDNIPMTSNANWLFLCSYNFPNFSSFNSSGADTSNASQFKIEFYYNKTDNTISYVGNYVNTDSSNSKTFIASMTYIID